MIKRGCHFEDLGILKDESIICSGLSTTEDPKNFIVELKKVLEVMHIADIERVELDTYQLKGISRTWSDQR